MISLENQVPKDLSWKPDENHNITEICPLVDRKSELCPNAVVWREE